MVLIVSRRCNIIFQQNVQGKSPMVGGEIPKIRGLRQGWGGSQVRLAPHLGNGPPHVEALSHHNT